MTLHRRHESQAINLWSFAFLDVSLILSYELDCEQETLYCLLAADLKTDQEQQHFPKWNLHRWVISLRLSFLVCNLSANLEPTMSCVNAWEWQWIPLELSVVYLSYLSSVLFEDKIPLSEWWHSLEQTQIPVWRKAASSLMYGIVCAWRHNLQEI